MKKTNKNKHYFGNVSQFSETEGYFLGQFMGERRFPLLETDEAEITWKKIPTVFNEDKPHFHKVRVEINIVIPGRYQLIVNGKKLELKKGDFLVVYPEAKLINLSADEGTELIVVKAPSVPNDKFD